MIKFFTFLLTTLFFSNISIAQAPEKIKLNKKAYVFQRENDLFTHFVNGGFNGFNISRHNFIAYKNSLIKYGSIKQRVKSNTASFFFSKSSKYWFVEDYFKSGLINSSSGKGKFIRYTRFSLKGKIVDKSFSEKQYFGKFAKENLTKEALFFGNDNLFRLYSYLHEGSEDSTRKYFLTYLDADRLKLDQFPLQITDSLAEGPNVSKWEFISAENNQLVLALKNMDAYGNEHKIQINKYNLSAPSDSPQSMELNFETPKGFVPAPYTIQIAGSFASFNEFTIPDGISKNYHFNYSTKESTSTNSSGGTSTTYTTKVSLPNNNTSRSHIRIIGNRIYIYGLLFNKNNAVSLKSKDHYYWYCKCFDLVTGDFLFDCDGDSETIWDQHGDQQINPKPTNNYDKIMYVAEANSKPIIAFTSKKVPEMFYVTFKQSDKGKMAVNNTGKMNLGLSDKSWNSVYLQFVDIYIRNKKLLDSIDFKALKKYEKIIETFDSVYFINYRGITGFEQKTVLHKFKKNKK